VRMRSTDLLHETQRNQRVEDDASGHTIILRWCIPATPAFWMAFINESDGSSRGTPVASRVGSDSAYLPADSFFACLAASLIWARR
jgi:hypothetical protein